ncbi:hypothetical protein Rhopal_005520-T1 [Rhodotorula paludigena]|uniref:FHA domain-containing protein n=1 Tax=Rhodotorula paludigena TaxID=86838 RepID=A0AAV5GSL5_9BASI|nr:hypothetical protein Rhopal_005520-T1 [Rhodotorula paludigena]
MLPYDGEPVQAPSTSAWQWAPAYGLYFNALTRQWAKPKPDGTWEYADGVQEGAGGDTEGGSAEQSEHGSQGAEERPADKADPAKEEVHEGDKRGGREGQGRQLLQYDDDGPALDALPPEQVWPGSDDDDAPAPPDPLAKAPLLRLVVDKRADSTVLPPAQCVASIDPGEPVSIGRDKSFERRIRLRELAVSKAHCTLFWALDPETEDGGYWAVVDNASTHGTFLSSDRGDREIRLSEPKVASVPHRLHHFDTLRAGSTTFRVHIHASFACSSCSVASDSSNLIPLIATPSEDKSSTKPTFLTKTKEQKEQDRREQMAGLRAKLLKPSSATSASSSSSSSNGTAAPSPAKSDSKPGQSPAKPTFIDRAAARRQRDAGSSSAPPAPRRAPLASAAARDGFVRRRVGASDPGGGPVRA